MSKCQWYLCENNTNTKFCCIKCKNKFHTKKKRKELKTRSIEYKGGCCENCGYSKCIDALEFHHVDATQKDFGIAASGITRSWDKMKIELDKCILLCSNCHREIHAELKID